MDSFEGHPRARGGLWESAIESNCWAPKGQRVGSRPSKNGGDNGELYYSVSSFKKEGQKMGKWDYSGNKETTARRAQQHSITPLYCSQPAAVAGRSPAALYIFICIPSFAVCVVYVLKMGLTRCSFPFSLFSKSKKGRKKLSPPVNFQAYIEAHYIAIIIIPV
jgi:hypothetical protein